MSSTQKAKYVQMFSSNDRLQKGFLTGNFILEFSEEANSKDF